MGDFLLFVILDFSVSTGNRNCYPTKTCCFVYSKASLLSLWVFYHKVKCCQDIGKEHGTFRALRASKSIILLWIRYKNIVIDITKMRITLLLL